MLLAGCSSIQNPIGPASFANNIEENSVRLNKAHTSSINGVILLNVLRARDYWPTGYTTLSGIRFDPTGAFNLQSNLNPLGLGNPSGPLQSTTATIARNTGASASYTINPFANSGENAGLYTSSNTQVIFETYLGAGWPIEIIFPLMIDTFTIGKGKTAKICKLDGEAPSDDPRDDASIKWQSCVSHLQKNLFGKEAKLKKPETDNWKCIPDSHISKTLEVGADDTLSARIASLVSIAKDNTENELPKKDKKQINTKIVLTNTGFQRCERENVTVRNQFFQGEDKQITITSYRSFDDMVYFLGETLRTETGFNTSAKNVSKPLFQIDKGQFNSGQYAVSVEHGGQIFQAAKLRDNGSRTGSVLAILSQILLFNQNPKFLEAPENFFN